MSTYADVDDVRGRIGGRAITTTSNPTTAQVGDWLDEAEAELLGAMAAVGIPTSYASDTTGFLTLRGWVARYVSGLVRKAHAAASGDGDNDDGVDDINWWVEKLEKIKADPDGTSSALGNGSTATETIGIGSHATDSTLSLSDADVAATFQRGRFNF